MADLLTSHILAADNHNIGNIGASWLDPEAWVDKVGDGGKLIATSMLSGANSFYNTAISVGNWFGADLSQSNTQTFIANIDSDLGAYYRQNADAADFGGFLLGSMIPGLGGVKLFNAGQTALRSAVAGGRIGKNLSNATGLLLPKTEQYLDNAVNAINSSLSAHKLLNANTMKALGAGFYQNVLESAAFEVSVQATMFKSPILEQQDGMDIAKNILTGGLVGGVIGGAFESAKIFGTLKKATRTEDAARLPFSNRPAFADITDPVERIMILAEDTDLAAVPVSLNRADGTIVNNNYAVNKSLYEDKVRKNNNDIRTSIHTITPGDGPLANVVANTTQGLPHPQIFSNFAGATEITRIDVLSAGDKALAKAAAKNEPAPAFANRYVKLIGEDAGTTTANAPAIKSLGDIHGTQEGVLDAVKKYKFSAQKLWNPLEEIGRSSSAYLEAEGRHIWAQDVLKEVKDGMVIHEFDIPVLQRALHDDAWSRIKVSKDSGLQQVSFNSRDELAKYIASTQEYVASKLMKREKFAENTEAVSVITNMKRDYIEGTRTNNADDLFAMQATDRAYKKVLESKGLSSSAAENVDPKYLPKYAKVTYALDRATPDSNVVDALVLYKQKQTIYQEAARRIGARILGTDIVDSLPQISDSALHTASRTGSGPGLFSSENSNYGTLGSSMAWLGSKSRQAKEQIRKDTQNALEGPLSRMGQSLSASLEFEAANQKITRSGKLWIPYDEDGKFALVTKDGKKQYGVPETDPEKQLPTGRILLDLDSMPETDIIRFANEQTRELVGEHIRRTGIRTEYTREIRAAQGHTDNKDSEVFRPIRPNLRDYPHFAFVVDPKVSGTGHMTMIHAATDKDLSELIDRVPTNYKVVTKQDSEDFFKARGEYEHSRTLHENYLDSDLKNKGIFSNFFPKTNPQKIVDDILQQHLREDDSLVYETMRLMYEPQFNWLEDLGKTYAKTSTSKFASFTESLEKTLDNPYFNYIKTALDISKASEYPLLYSFNKGLDSAFSRGYAAVREAFGASKAPADLERVNAVMDQQGMRPAFLPAYDAGMYELSNHTAPRGELTKFVRAANGILGRFTLGLDPLNALNNAIGANILRGTELKHLTDAIRTGNNEVAGALADISKISLPGTGDQILSPAKLVGTAIENFFKDNGTLVSKYRGQGLIKDRLDQFKLILEDFTLKGTETVPQLGKLTNSAFERAKSLADAGEKLTGNTFAEEFNRFISANVMDQITEVGVRNKLLSPAEAMTYVNTFVNRVEGNIIASQRPLVFQGPIGQAVGLFQSYQFNLLQQLFRYVAEGSKKDLAMLVGLQSTLYGVQGLPAFQFVNTHIVGQLSGNQQHRDLYDQTYGAAGKTAGDFILYGLPSNMLQANIYSRGDINPRQITILPTSLQEVPVVSGWGKFFNSMRETVSNIGLGGSVWESMLRGMEHNGISRPLAGLAQVLQTTQTGQVVSTSQKGSILGSHDLMQWASITRLAGGRPLDEAAINDAMFRVNAYEGVRREQLQGLSEAVKSSMLAGTSPSDSQINSFAEKYAYLGGKQSGFNKWMMGLYKSANVPQAQQLEQSMRNPYVYKLQLLMGGEE